MFTYFAKAGTSDIYRLIFIVGIATPFFIAIGRGLPLDCLDFDAAIKKEVPNS